MQDAGKQTQPGKLGEVSQGPPDSQTPSGQDWWDDPSLPWKHKPTAADLACFSWLGVVAIYSLVMLPLRPVLLETAPNLLASIGSWTGLVLVGARAAVGDPWWPLVWLVATFGLIKFDWIYWWAGRLWGRDLIEVWSGRSERARKANERAERFARKYETWAIVATFLPIPLPRAVIFAVLGEAGTSLRKFLTVAISSSFVSAGGYLAVGYWIGEPAVVVMETYGRYLWYLSLAILVAMVASYWWRQRSLSR